MASFNGLFKPTAIPSWLKPTASTVFRDQFELSTLLLIGAIVQGLLSLIGGRLALLPAVVAALVKIGDCYAQHTGLRRNKAADDIIMHKFSAQFPDSQGDYGNKPARDDVCVFLIGAKNSGALGVFEPGFKELGDRFQAMVDSLQENPEEWGFLGASAWLGTAQNSNNDILTIMYFKRSSDVHRFAQSEIHRSGWNWWSKELSGKPFAIYHELYQVPSGNWETIYSNSAPLLAAGTQNKVTGPKGESQWLSSIVDARRGLLKTSQGRMSRSDGKENDKYDVTDGYDLAQKF